MALLSLRESLDPLREFFNAHPVAPRLLAVVSPTCGPCTGGAEALSGALHHAPSETDLPAALVWIPMLPGDAPSAAEVIAKRLDHPRLLHFYDAERRAGRAIATSLGWSEDVAWDVYLLYPAGATWGANPPRPQEWAHQLGGWERADPRRFRTGPALGQELHRLVAMAGRRSKTR